MSIKIDLLPGYVNLRRWFRRIIWGAGALLGGVGAILFVLYYRDKQELAKVSADLTGIEPNASAADDSKKRTKAITDSSEPIETTVRFFVDAGRTGAERAALLDLVKRYIYVDAYVSSVDLSDGKTAVISARVRSPEDYGNFLFKLRNGSASNGGVLFAADPTSNSVKASGLPGFGTGGTTPAAPAIMVPTDRPEEVTLPLAVNVTASLKNPVETPSAPGESTATPADAGAAGAPGAPPPAAP